MTLMLLGDILPINVGNALLPLHTRLQISQTLAPGINAQIPNLSEGDSGPEGLGIPSLGDLAVELVDLFEGKTLEKSMSAML